MKYVKFQKNKHKKFRIKTSKLEKKFGLLLREMGIQFKTQHRVGYKYFDFYLPKYNTLIEIDGDYWHANPKKYTKPINQMQKNSIINDIYKTKLAEAAKYKIIRFWEDEINNNVFIVRKKIWNIIKENNKG